MNADYWQKQSAKKPLFSDILWSKPERKVGRLAIVGGNSRGFSAAARAFSIAEKLGVGDIKVLLPASLKNNFSPAFDVTFLPANPSGGLAKKALPEMRAAAEFAKITLVIGDLGANSETAALLEDFVAQTESPIFIARDAVDLVANSSENILNRANVHLILSLSQLQKLAKNVYYPRVITFSEGAAQIAETLHKFTLTFPASATLWHAGQLFFAQNGRVFSQDFGQPMRVWSGEIAARETVFAAWFPESDLAKSVVSAWAEL